jgi:methionyl-tRNA formyltransferase
VTGAPLRLAFAGTPEPAAIILERLLQAPDLVQIDVVYTQPDRPAGRGRKLHPSPVKQLAESRGLVLHQPASADELIGTADLAGYDLMVVVAYGLLLPQSVLEQPRLGCVNLHFSLLPRWRGAAPVQRALLAGDTETGVSLMQMDTGLDTGPILAQRCWPIGPTDTAGDLLQQLAQLGAESLVDVLPQLAAGKVEPVPQDDSRACYARKISKDEAWLDWHQPAQQLARRVRAFNPAPIARTDLAGLDCRIWSAEAVEAPADASPGTVVAAGKHGIDVVTGDGILRILRLQLPGRRILTAAEFLNGRPDFVHSIPV